MKKKIHVMDVQLGMYVLELDRPWIETPFLFQGFEISQQEEIDQLREHCQYVFIDVERGPDVAPAARDDAYKNRIQQLQNVEKEIKNRIERLVSVPDSDIKPSGRKSYLDTASLETEMVQAKEIQKLSRETMATVLHDAQAGEKIDIDRIGKAAEGIIDSVLRNPDALVCLSQLKSLSQYDALHSIRSCIIGLSLGRHLAFGRDELKNLGLGLLLHDIGMTSVPESILNKPGALNKQEFEVLKRHVPKGLEILKNSGDLPISVEDCVTQHHERADGSGYPSRKGGDRISTAGAIVAIIDVYDAITSRRTYHDPISAEDALKRMYEWRGCDFNGPLVEEFIKCMGIFPIGSLVELSNGAVGVVITINRARRLKPKIVVVLNPDKKPYVKKIVVDLADTKDQKIDDIHISRVLPSGSYKLNPMEHIVAL